MILDIGEFYLAVWIMLFVCCCCCLHGQRWSKYTQQMDFFLKSKQGEKISLECNGSRSDFVLSQADCEKSLKNCPWHISLVTGQFIEKI